MTSKLPKTSLRQKVIASFLLSAIASAGSAIAKSPGGQTALNDDLRPGVKISGEEKHSGNLVLTGYTEEASGLFKPFLDDSTFKKFSGTAPFLFTTNLDGVAASSRLDNVKYDDPDRFIDPKVTNVIIPPNSARVINVLYWPVPDYGLVWLRADNDGNGYSLRHGGDVLVLNLNFEFARTHLRLLKNRAKTASGKKPRGLSSDIAEAERLLAQAAGKNGAEKARLADDVLAQVLKLGDDLEFELAKQQIPQSRAGKVTLKIVDAAGNPVEGANVKFVQTNHDFLFGCVESFGFTSQSMKESAFRRVFKTLREDGFNHFTASLFWDQLEEKPGQYRFNEWNSKLGLQHAVNAGFSLKMHALLQESVPKHVKGSNLGNFTRASKRYFDEATTHYNRESALGKSVVIWQAANEPSTNTYSGFDEDQKIDLLRKTVDNLRTKNVSGKILINDVYADWGQRNQGGGDARHVVSPYEMFGQLNRRGINYDLMGLEWYPGLRVNFFGILQLHGPLQDFLVSSAELDRFAQLKKPLHITEFAIPGTYESSWKSGWWRKKWDANVQAEYAERFYTIAFSKPHIHEITYWGVSDNEPWEIEGGLMTKDYQPKPILDTLSRLIKSWTSNGTVSTDRSGNAQISGFGGEYTLTIEKNGMTRTHRMHITEQTSKVEKVTFAK